MINTDNMLDALNQLEEMKAAMPERCPSWCIGEHVRAIEEGCTSESARVHQTHDVVGQTKPIQNERAHWNVTLLADPGCDRPVFYGAPYIELETSRLVEDEPERFMWRMDSGAARVLARQLLHFADRADLES